MVVAEETLEEEQGVNRSTASCLTSRIKIVLKYFLSVGISVHSFPTLRGKLLRA